MLSNSPNIAESEQELTPQDNMKYTGFQTSAN